MGGYIETCSASKDNEIALYEGYRGSVESTCCLWEAVGSSFSLSQSSVILLQP